MSNLVPAATILDKGLDLQTPKVVAQPGTLLDALNYEQVDFQGQKRIDGYTRYDGSELATPDDFWYVTTDSTIQGEFTSGYVVTNNGQLWGIAAYVSGPLAYIVPIDKTIIPQEGDVIKFEVNREDALSDLDGTQATIVSAEHSHSGSLLPEEQYEALLQVSSTMRSYVEKLPGAIIGLHWFRDRLYAVADVYYIGFSGPTPAVHPNETITLFSENSSYTAKVLDSYLTDDNNRIVFLDTVGINDTITNAEINSQDLGSITQIGAIPDSVRMLASFFESRTEKQAIEEDGSYAADYGWKFNHLGWEVGFDSGKSLYGRLVALNQNRSGIGVQGPTSIDGQNGSPNALYQKVNITNVAPQVNGWKSSGSPDSYALNPNDIISDDSSYTYADAFITWDGNTGDVIAPGSTMSGLEEYPSTNTVVFEEF